MFGEDRQPLLDNNEQDQVVFSIDSDNDDGDGDDDYDNPHSSKQSGRSVRFDEETQVIPPTLRSAVQSRETGM